MLVGSDNADLCLCKGFGFWANSALMWGWRFFASMRCLRRWKVWFIIRTWYLKLLVISCCNWCISLKSLRSVTYSFVTSETDSRSSSTGISIGCPIFSIISTFVGSGRRFFSTFSNLTARVSSWTPAFFTYMN